MAPESMACCCDYCCALAAQRNGLQDYVAAAPGENIPAKPRRIILPCDANRQYRA
jgi:hypothetical protein